MSFSEPVNLVLTTAAMTAISSALIPFFHEIKGKFFPPLEYLENKESDKSTKITMRSQKERVWFIVCHLVLGFFVGLELTFYWLGFEKTPNIYQQMFWALLLGFLTPQILTYVHGLSIEKIREKL